MDKTQLKIIKQLFARPNDQNATEEELKNNLGILESDFRIALNSLLSDKAIIEITNKNQNDINLEKNNTNLKSYALTLIGAVALDKSNKFSFDYFIDRNGKWIGFVVLLAGLLGLFVQITIASISTYTQRQQLEEEKKKEQLYEVHVHSCSCGCK